MSDNPQDTNTQQPSTQASATTETQPENTGQDKLFTQADLDRVINDRLKRANETITAKILESLGVESLDTAKAEIEAKRNADAAAMTEIEKAQAEIQKAKTEAEQYKQQVEAIQAQRIADGRQSVFSQAIRKSGGANEDQLYILVNAQMTDDYGSVFEDGTATADDAKLQAFIKQVQSKYPSYFGTAGAGSPSNAGGINPTSKQQALKDAEDEIKNLF